MAATEPRGPVPSPPPAQVGGPLRRLVWNTSLGWQLSALYSLLLVITLSLVGALVYTQQESFLVQDTAGRLTLAARRIMDLPAPPQFPAGRGGPSPGEIRPPQTDRLVENLIRGLSGTGVTVAALDPQGTVLTTTQGLAGDSPRTIDPVTPQQAAAALAGDQPVSWVARRADGSRQVVVLAAIVRRTTDSTSGATGPAGTRGEAALLEQSASLEAVDAALDRLGATLLLGVLGGTLAGVVLGLALTRAVLRPLDRVAGTAEAIAAGDLGRRLRLPPGRSEVARLGQAFDYMVGRLVAALEAQRRFVADASHELRTPLTSLQGLAEILMIGAHGNDPRVIEQSARAIHDELDRLNRLVNDLLTLSRLDSTGGHVTEPGLRLPAARRVTMDACAPLAGAVTQMGPLAEARGVQLAQECAGPLWIAGDAGQLKQVVLNLLDNALRYTATGGTVTVRAVAAGAQARVEVRDSGSGIAARDLPHVFERFYRGDASRTRATGNSGLGLAIVRAIIEAHGGQITVQSAPGAGTCFTILFPLAAGEGHPAGQVDAAHEAAPAPVRE